MIVSSSALNLPTFTGTIISENNIDLSGIEVKIYSSEPVYDEEGDLLYYAEMYEMSVLTNSDGEFEFIKPSVYCSYTVNIKTLPVGYGISKHTQFVVPSRIADTITVAPVATAETTLDGDNIIATFFDANGNTLYTDYEVVPDESISSDIENMGNISTSEMIMSYSALKALDSYTYSGTIVTSGKNFRYSKEYDLLNFSQIDKTNFLFSVGKISETEKLNFYCDYLNEKGNNTIPCGTNIVSELQNYRNVDNSNDIELLKKIDTVLPLAQIPEYIQPVQILNNYVVNVYYNNSISDSTLTRFCNILKEVVEYYCSLGFPFPCSENEGFYQILIDANFTGVDGVTVSYVDSCKSYIKVPRSIAVGESEKIEQVLSHEYTHAIMYDYGIYEEFDWFHEAFASMSCLVYCGESNSWFKNAVDTYMQYSNESLFTTPNVYFPYGALVYPLTVYDEFGGWSAIKNIFRNFNNYDSDFESICGTNFNYSSAFKEMVLNNYDPRQYSLAPKNYLQGDLWNRPNVLNCELSQSLNAPVNPMASRYFRYSSTSNIGDLSITIETIGNIPISVGLLVLNGISNIESQQINQGSRITFTIDDFGSNSASAAVIIPISTDFNGSTVRYTLTTSC